MQATVNYVQINDMKIIKGEKGRFLSMPTREYINSYGKKQYCNVVYLRKEILDELQRIIFNMIK